MNKRAGILGSTTTLFVMTILIVIVLLLFVLGSGAIRKIDRSNAGLKVYTLEEIGLNNLKIYMENYKSLLNKIFTERENE